MVFCCNILKKTAENQDNIRDPPSLKYEVDCVYCPLYLVHCTVDSGQSTVDSVQWTVYSGECTVHSVQWTVYSE